MKEAAKRLGAHATTVANWEAGRTGPALAHLPKIVNFLEYDPRPAVDGIGRRLKRHRTTLGITQEAMARWLGVDPSTLARWEREERQPQGKYLAKIDEICDRFLPVNLHSRVLNSDGQLGQYGG